MKCMYVGKEGGCGNEGSHEWNVGALCDAHYGLLAETYLDKKSIPSDVLDDFLKVHVLLQFNVKQCLDCIDKLGQEMSVAKRNAGNRNDPRFSQDEGDNYLKLSRALEYYEGYCWFPANRTMFTNILRPEDFYTHVKYGLNKDPGAGASHGDQSHRIQWHAIMRCMTNNFTKPVAAGWNHSPLGLFYEYTQGSGKDTGAWAKSMDLQANKGWGSPDNIWGSIISHKTPFVSDALSDRMKKMGPTGTFRYPPGGSPTVNPLEQYTRKKAGSSYTQQQDKKGAAIPVLVKKDAPDRLVGIDQNLVNKSKGSFNTDYVYGDAAGAHPQVPQRW